ncbi:hypothetical protein BDW62DRAFT_52741 [Aspergillus aurantiobrunneus]
MPKKSTIVQSSFPNSSPHLTRSEIILSTLSNLTQTDAISRCYIDSATITKNSSSSPNRSAEASSKSQDQDSTLHLRRCNITSSTLSNTSARRCTITQSTLSNVPSARCVQATCCTLDNVATLRRVAVSNTTVAEGSALVRTGARDSVVSSSAVYRGSLERSRVVRSRVRKSRLADCEVSDCVIVNTDFRDMVLRNGVWRNGRLVGCCGEREEVTVDGKKLDMPVKREKSQGPEKWMQGMASETESSDFDDSDEEEEDLPPPYTP